VNETFNISLGILQGYKDLIKENNETVLKLILNVNKISFKLSRLFISNGLYDEMIRKDVI
jgi:hypothetical protein